MSPTTDRDLKHVEQQMLMARPWEAAEPESLWEITGEYPGGKHSFTECLAITLPEHVTGSERPLFVFVGALATTNEPVDPAWITHARPLLLVHRDEPSTAYWVDDQHWITGAAVTA
ncbi:hypothetical protein [Pseudonocardia zijingensis]|uniref:SOS response associated peptidase (SRAP) n=1 Tax=Pseudonocardia zijingensis TaxID=153376 RepID=A0ABN1N8U9_9PSEU